MNASRAKEIRRLVGAAGAGGTAEGRVGGTFRWPEGSPRRRYRDLKSVYYRNKRAGTIARGV